MRLTWSSRALVTLVTLVAASGAAPALAAFMDTWADAVYGQADFTHKLINHGQLGADSLYNPEGVALDAAGNLYVADTANNRVLEFDAPLAAGGGIAERVFGQPDFIHNLPNYNGITADSLNAPFGVAVDSGGHLWVSDSGNNRVVVYNAPLTTDRTADAVFGQADFSHSLPNRGGTVNNNGFDEPLGLTLDAAGNLYVADFYNLRVLEFNTALTTGGVADRVFGQVDFTHNTAALPSAITLAYPMGAALDSHGNLYVADNDNARVLEYDKPLSTDATADHVFGQANFTSNSPNHSGINASGLAGPVGLALDAHDNLYVADSSNNRLLEYLTPLSGSNSADRVFGQPGFGTAGINQGGLGAGSLHLPFGLALNANGDLFVADSANERVLVYRSFAHGLSLPLVRR